MAQLDFTNAKAGGYCALYRQITGESVSDGKCAQRVAHLIEEEIIVRNLAIGHRVGSEADIADVFSVGRSSAREAIRILQLRGSGQMRRGPGGGLEVAALKRPSLVDAFCAHFDALGTGTGTLLEAKRCLNAIATALAPNGSTVVAADARFMQGAAVGTRVTAPDTPFHTALGLFDECLETFIERSKMRVAGPCLSEHSSDESYDLSASVMSSDCGSRTQAEALAERIARDIGRHLQDGDLIGSEAALQDRYNAGRMVMRQAIRIVEERGLARTARGRGHGLVAARPSSGPLARLMCTYLIQQAPPMRSIWEVMRLLHVQDARLAAGRSMRENHARIRRILDGIRTWEGPFECLPVAESETQLSRMSCNAVLNVFVRSLQAYCMWASNRHRVAMRNGASEHLSGYRGLAQSVWSAIREGDIRGAGEAEWHKHDYLAHHVWRARHADSLRA